MRRGCATTSPTMLHHVPALRRSCSWRIRRAAPGAAPGAAPALRLRLDLPYMAILGSAQRPADLGAAPGAAPGAPRAPRSSAKSTQEQRQEQLRVRQEQLRSSAGSSAVRVSKMLLRLRLKILPLYFYFASMASGTSPPSTTSRRDHSNIVANALRAPFGASKEHQITNWRTRGAPSAHPRSTPEQPRSNECVCTDE